MTREQAKREIDSLDFYLQNHTDDYGEESHTAMMMAIEALEQEPCEDATSRQAVIDEIEFFQINPQHFDFVSLIDNIKDLPSVKPQLKTGHWIKLEYWTDRYKVQCSECAQIFEMGTEIINKHCPNCVTKMVEPQESEGE